jgi:hypothetical protein
MAIDFAKKGADIVLVSRSEEKLKLALGKVEVSIPNLIFNVGRPRITRAEVWLSYRGSHQCRGSKRSNYIL